MVQDNLCREPVTLSFKHNDSGILYATRYLLNVGCIALRIAINVLSKYRARIFGKYVILPDYQTHMLLFFLKMDMQCLHTIATRAFSRGIRPLHEGALPYVYVKPLFLSPRTRKLVEEGKWDAPELDHHNARSIMQYGSKVLASAEALENATKFPGMPVSAIGKRPFVVRCSNYDPESNELCIRVDSDLDMAFWLELRLPIAVVEEAFATLPRPTRREVPCQGRVNGFIEIFFWRYSSYRLNPGVGRNKSVTATLHATREKPSCVTVEVRAAHCPKFGLFVDFTPNSLSMACSMMHPGTDPVQLEILKKMAISYNAPEVAQAMEDAGL